MGILTFPFAQVQALMREAESARELFTTGAQLLDPDVLKPGRSMPEDGYADPDDIDPAKVPPGLVLFANRGIFLTSNAVLAEGAEPIMVFAHECDPRTMKPDEWIHAKQPLYGGDDGAEFINLSSLHELEADVVRNQLPIDRTLLRIVLHDTHIDLEVLALPRPH